jgi:hypothetical protein
VLEKGEERRENVVLKIKDERYNQNKSTEKPFYNNMASKFVNCSVCIYCHMKASRMHICMF